MQAHVCTRSTVCILETNCAVCKAEHWNQVVNILLAQVSTVCGMHSRALETSPALWIACKHVLGTGAQCADWNQGVHILQAQELNVQCAQFPDWVYLASTGSVHSVLIESKLCTFCKHR